MAGEIGFSLEIPDGLLKDLESVDNRLENIAEQAKNTTDIFNGQMARMASGNITSLLQQVNQLKSSLASISGDNSSSIGVSNLGNSAESATKDLLELNTVVALIADSINKMNQQINEGSQIKISAGSIAAYNKEASAMQKNFARSGDIDAFNNALDELDGKYADIAKQASIAGVNISKVTTLSKDVRDSLQKGIIPDLEIGELEQAQKYLIALRKPYQDGSTEAIKYTKALKEVNTQLKAVRDASKAVSEQKVTLVPPTLNQSLQMSTNTLDDIYKKMSAISNASKGLTMGAELAKANQAMEKLQAKAKTLQQYGLSSGKTPDLSLTKVLKLSEDSVDDLTKKIKELQRIQSVKSVDLTDEKSVARNQKLLQQIDSLIDKRKEIQTVQTKPIELKDIIQMDESSLSQIEAKLKALQTLQKQTTVDLSSTDSVARNNALLLQINQLIQKQTQLKTISATPLTLVEIDKLPESTIDSLTLKIKELQKYQKTVDIVGDDALADNQKLLKQIDDLKNKLKEVSTISKVNITTESALASSNEAKSIAQRTEAIKQLKIARDNLNDTEDDYKTKLDNLNAAIQRNTKLNNDATGATDRLKKSQTQLMNITGQLARQAALYFSVSQIQGYINKLAQVRGEFELQQKSLQAIMQNKYEADKVWGQIVDLSVRSPFRLSELTSYTKQLAAYRIENEKIFDTTKMLADISAGLGVDMSRLILAYGQVKAANYLRGTELRQFSEAGINILGELSDYFTELEGRAISTADVFEMVSKRMVTFGDVEVVFKRLTDAGGIFYNMQELQAETLAGKISNLGDAIDIMLNKIGTENEAALKGGIDTVRLLAENYEYIGIALESLVAGFGVYSIQVARATLLNKGFASSQLQATISSGGLASAMAKVVTGLKSMTLAMMKNPITLAAVGITAAVGIAIKRMNDMEEASKFYDTLTNQLQDTKSSFESLTAKIETNNQSINRSRNNLNSLDKGSKEYIETQKELNSSIDRQDALLKELQAKMPDAVKGLKQQEDGTINLTTAVQNLNVQLSLMSTLNYLAKQSGSFWTDDVKNNIEDATQAYIDYKLALGDVNSAYNIFKSNINEQIINNAQFEKAYGEQLKGIFDSGMQPLQQLESITKIINSQYDKLKGGAYSLTNEERQGFVILKGLQEDYYSSVKAAQKAQKNYLSDANTLSSQFASIVSDFASTIDKGLPTDVIRKQVEAFINSFGIQEQAIRDLVGSEFETKLNIDLDFDIKEVEQPLSFIQQQINEYIAKNNLGIEFGIKEIKFDETAEDYFKRIQEELKLSQEESKRLSEATTQLNKDLANTDAKKAVDDRTDSLISFLATFGRYNETLKKSETTENRSLKLMKSQISLIQKMNSEYEKLRKSFSDEEALSRVMTSFANSMSELDLTEFMVGKGLSDSDVARIFSSEKFKTAAAKAGKEASIALSEALGESKVEIDIDIQTSTLNKIAKDIEGMFDRYDLTLDLKNLGFTADQSKELFDFDFTSLNDLQKYIKSNRDALFALGTDGEKEYQDTMSKITDMEVKAQKERNKRVYDILRQSYTEREQLEIDYQKNLEDIRKSELSSEAKQQATTNVTAQYKLDVAELDYKDFKLTDEYIKAFEDLDNFGEATIDHLLRMFDDFSKTANLSPETLKVLMDKIQELQTAAIDRNPFETLKNSVKAYTESIKEAKLAQADLAEAEQQESVATTQQVKAQVAFDSTTEGTIEHLAALWNLEDANKQLAIATDNTADASKRAADADDKRIKALNDASRAVTATEEGFNVFANAVSSSVDLVKDLAEGLGVALDPETEAVLDGINQGLSITAAVFPIITAVIVATDVAAKSLMSTLLPILAAAAVIGGILAIFNAADARREKTIEAETRKVEQLQAAYDKLYASFEQSYKHDELEGTTEAMLQNIDEQIASLERARAAELDKKKTDQDAVDSYNEQIAAAREQALAAELELTRELGGIGSDEYKNAAQEFLEAWEDAFMETGDGLSGLEQSFDDMINNAIRSAAMSRVVSKYLNEMFEDFDALSSEGYTEAEIAKFQQDNKDQLANMSDELEALYKAFGVTAGSAVGELSSLQQGIQSITAPQAAAIEAYLNSVRFEVYRQGEVMNNMLLAMQAVGGLNNTENSIIYKELANQTLILKSMDNRLASVIGDGATSYIKTNL